MFSHLGVEVYGCPEFLPASARDMTRPCVLAAILDLHRTRVVDEPVAERAELFGPQNILPETLK